MNVLIPRFEEENPGIKVNAVSREWADLHDKILISAQSNTLPDVARLDIAWVPEFQKMGILTALDEEMADFDSVTADLLESAMSTGFVSGHYYAMALNTNTKILFYNEKALEEAGVAVPATMDEFVKAVAAVSGKNSAGQTVWGLNEPALAGWNVLPYIWSNGGEITNEDNTKASGYINSEKTIAAVQMLADMAKNGELSGYNSGDIPMTDGFGTGRYIFLLEGPWKTAELAGAYPDIGLRQLPAARRGSRIDLRARRRGYRNVQRLPQGRRVEVHAVYDEPVCRGRDGQVRPDPREQDGARERNREECFLRSVP